MPIAAFRISQHFFCDEFSRRGVAPTKVKTATEVEIVGGKTRAECKVKTSLNWHFLRDGGVAPTGGIHAILQEARPRADSGVAIAQL